MKHAVVTGGTGGIGAGVASALAEDGWRVTVTGATDAEVSAFDATGSTINAAALDVTDAAAVTRFFDQIEQLDGLVNCAGILLKQAEFEIESFQRVIDVNLTGTMRCCVAARQLLENSGGAIVNTASMYAIFGGPHAPGYTASKGGVAQLTKSLAGAWAEHGIRVNAIAPGWIETAMTEPIRHDPSREGPIMDRTPLSRWGQPTEVGALVAWLLSDKAGYMTGTVIPVDGGYSAM